MGRKFQRIHQGDQSGVGLGAREELSGAATEVSRNIEGASQNGVGAGGHRCGRSTTAQLEKLVPRLHHFQPKGSEDPRDKHLLGKGDYLAFGQRSGASRERLEDRHLGEEGTVWQVCC